jgi:competence protein ComEA
VIIPDGNSGGVSQRAPSTSVNYNTLVTGNRSSGDVRTSFECRAPFSAAARTPVQHRYATAGADAGTPVVISIVPGAHAGRTRTLAVGEYHFTQRDPGTILASCLLDPCLPVARDSPSGLDVVEPDLTLRGPARRGDRSHGDSRALRAARGQGAREMTRMVMGALLAAFLATVPVAVVQASQDAPDAKAAPAAVVNLNTATAAQLEALPGIGPKVAQRIVEYRQKNGAFKKVEELMNVKGIGEKSFLKLKPHLTVGAPKA